MENQLTKRELDLLAETARAGFEEVTLTPLTQRELLLPHEENELHVDYELHDGRMDCRLTRLALADGIWYRFRMSAPLSGDLPSEAQQTEREKKLCQDEREHDLLCGVYNRRYLETTFARNLALCASQGLPAAAALITIDHDSERKAEWGQSVWEQVVCYTANQWKKYYCEIDRRIVGRIEGDCLVVGAYDMTEKELEEQMRSLYRRFPKSCVVTDANGIHRVGFTLSIACIGTDEGKGSDWNTLYRLCRKRREDAAREGGNRVYTA